METSVAVAIAEAGGAHLANVVEVLRLAHEGGGDEVDLVGERKALQVLSTSLSVSVGRSTTTPGRFMFLALSATR